jgi:uncharacterized protein YkwD/uncharacterized membrane protein required for colicin V production
MSQSTALELLAVVVVGVCCLVGVRRGFVFATFDLLILAGALAAAGRIYRPGGAALAAASGWQVDVAEAIAFVLTFAFAEIIRVQSSSVLRHAGQGSASVSPSVTYLDQLAGLLPGALRGLVFLAAVVVAIQSLALAGPLRPTVTNAPLVSLALRAVYSLGLGDPSSAVDSSVSDATANGALVGEATTAPYSPNSNLGLDASAELQVVQMTNLARTQAGLVPFRVDPKLAPLARQHAAEMLDLGYFGHDSPTLGSLAERAGRAGVVYQDIAENVAYASTISSAFQALLASPPHRQNLLSPNLGRIGVGVARSSQGDFVITQDFAN